MDFGNRIEMLRVAREETPAVASYQSAPPSKSKSEAETIQKAKETEFPIAPDHSAAQHKQAPQKKKRSKPSVKKN